MNSTTTNQKMNFSIVQLNNGGKGHNPFEYFYDNGYDPVTFPRKIDNTEWDYKKILGDLTAESLLEYLGSLNKTDKYKGFNSYLKTIQEPLIQHFFSDPKKCDHILTLENKFGRSNSEIKRFNPVEFGYDPVYFEKNDIDQFNYVKQYSINNGDITWILMKCLEVPFMNPEFSFENTRWLSNDYDIERVYDIILYDMFKTFSVYKNHEQYSKIYIENTIDKRLDRIIKKLDSKPAIIVTQEGGFDDSRVNLEYSVDCEGGVKLYSYNMDIEIYRVNQFSHTVTYTLGTKKGFDLEFVVNNNMVRLCGLHCKEPKNERTYELFVGEGIKGLINHNISSYMNYINMAYDWMYYSYYGIEKKMNIIMGDMNPKNMEKSKYIKELIESGNNMVVYPKNNEVTSKKTRSGYCAQLKKFWEKSESCKDMIIVDKNVNVSDCWVYPNEDELLTKDWIGDHSCVIVDIAI